MNNKSALNFIGYFVLFPMIFLLSSFLWKYIIKKYELMNSMTDSLSVLGIYYILISLIFMFLNIKNISIKDIK